jgi:peptidoglycan hydrolase-like protein with peptidoglycan-binding domain
VNRNCRLLPEQPAYSPPQRQCVLNAFRARANAYRVRLQGDALAESRLSPEDRAALQGKLIELGLLQGPADGEFGHVTREAIKRFQAQLGETQNALLTRAQSAMLMEGTSTPQEQAASPAGAPAATVSKETASEGTSSLDEQIGGQPAGSQNGRTRSAAAPNATTTAASECRMTTSPAMQRMFVSADAQRVANDLRSEPITEADTIAGEAGADGFYKLFLGRLAQLVRLDEQRVTITAAINQRTGMTPDCFPAFKTVLDARMARVAAMRASITPPGCRMTIQGSPNTLQSLLTERSQIFIKAAVDTVRNEPITGGDIATGSVQRLIPLFIRKAKDIERDQVVAEITKQSGKPPTVFNGVALGQNTYNSPFLNYLDEATIECFPYLKAMLDDRAARLAPLHEAYVKKAAEKAAYESEQAKKPDNVLFRAYMNYINTQSCYDARLGYLAVLISDVEMERAKTAIKNVETRLRPTLERGTDVIWDRAASGAALPAMIAKHGGSLDFLRSKCQQELRALLDLDPHAPVKDF